MTALRMTVTDFATSATGIATVAEDIAVLRGSVLLGSDLRSSCIVSDGLSNISFLDDASKLAQACSKPAQISIAESAGNAVSISFVSVSPAQDRNATLIALASGYMLKLVCVERPTAASRNVTPLGTLLSSEPHRWLGASWHPEFAGLLAAICQAEVRLLLCSSTARNPGPTLNGLGSTLLGSGISSGATSGAGTGAVASASQSASPFGAGATGRPSAGLRPQPQPLLLSRLQPAVAAPGPCRSSQCHVAWVGTARDSAGRGFGAAAATGDEDGLTLVVGWGPELELVSWSSRALREAAAATVAAPRPSATEPGARYSDGIYTLFKSEPLPLAPLSRRTLLLGVPGPLCAVSLGPYGSVLATTEAGLTLPYTAADPRHASLAGVEEPSGGSGRIDEQVQPAREQEQQQQRAPQGPGVIDLRGALPPLGGQSLAQGRGCDGAGPILSSLFNISAGSRLDEVDDAGGGCGLAATAGARGRPTAVVPRQYLLTDDTAPVRSRNPRASASTGAAAAAAAPASGSAPSASAAALCVVWPGRIAPATAGVADAGATGGGFATSGQRTRAAASCTGAGAALTSDPNGCGGRGDGGDGFRSLAPLTIPRPDLLNCCGELVLVASSLGLPAVAAFRLAPIGGLTQLALLTPCWPGNVIAAGRGRLCGLAAALVPPTNIAAAVASAAAEESGARMTASAGRQQRAAAQAALGELGKEGEAMLVLVVGDVEPPQAGGGIFGFGRTGRPAIQKLTRLVASAHPLPPLSAAAASTATAVAFRDITMATVPIAAAAAAGQVAASLLVDAGADADASPAPPASASRTADADPQARTEHASETMRMVSAAPAIAVAATATAVAAAGASDDDSDAVVRHLAELLAGLRYHVDQRLDELTSILRAQASRMDAMEAALAALAESRR